MSDLGLGFVVPNWDFGLFRSVFVLFRWFEYFCCILRASPFDLRKSYAFPSAMDFFRGYAAVLGFGRRSREVS
jgi:hypothetical protein